MEEVELSNTLLPWEKSTARLLPRVDRAMNTLKIYNYQLGLGKKSCILSP